MPEGNDPKAEQRMLLAVASRPVDTDTTFVTGADVSRFQRRSVPRQTVAPGGAVPSGGSTVDQQSMGPVVRILRGNNKIPDLIPVGGK